MCICRLPEKIFDEAFEGTYWRKTKQMQPVRLCILWGRQFEETFKNTQWRKAKQMQPMHNVYIGEYIYLATEQTKT